MKDHAIWQSADPFQPCELKDGITARRPKGATVAAAVLSVGAIVVSLIRLALQVINKDFTSELDKTRVAEIARLKRAIIRNMPATAAIIAAATATLPAIARGSFLLRLNSRRQSLGIRLLQHEFNQLATLAPVQSSSFAR